MATFALAWLSVIQAVMAVAPATALQDASSSLQGKSQCVAFKWVSDDESLPKAAISIPAVINGKAIPLQLDTGSDASMLYGHVADQAKWANPDQKSFRATSFMIGSTSIDRPEIHIAADMAEDTRLAGTLGLSELIGRITVIDYPNQRFCLFSEADLPAPLMKATYVRADLRNSKFFIPIAVETFQSDALVFDTGSSLTPVNVDLVTWKKLTGHVDVRKAPTSIKGTAWGKPLTLSGAPAAGPMMLGKLNLGQPMVFTDGAQPTAFADWSFRADGVLGNASLWNGIVILDLTAKVRFGYVR